MMVRMFKLVTLPFRFARTIVRVSIALFCLAYGISCFGGEISVAVVQWLSKPIHRRAKRYRSL